MTGLLLKWLVTTLAILAASRLVPGITVADFPTALAAAVVLGVLNLVVKPLLIVLTLPLTLFSLGLFLLVINAVVFQLVGVFVGGLEVSSFWSALGASLFVSLVSWVMQISSGIRGATPGTRFVIRTGRRPPSRPPDPKDDVIDV